MTTPPKTRSNNKTAQSEKPATIRNGTQQVPIVVGIGASAGGLEAFEAFFQAMPEDAGIAFVLVSHLDPGHASMLSELIQKKTKMKVSQVTDNMKIIMNQVFIIPPNKEMTIFNDRLQLMDMRKPRGAPLPIDIFFRSLAQDQGNRAIGIILSGTGTDGTLGIRAIKGEAGMIMAQDPDTARYDGMPKSAIATGLVDFILPPNRMPEQLMNFVRHKNVKQDITISVDEKDTHGNLRKIFALLRAATDHDFSQYKTNTIYRRIEKRMHVHQIDHIADYVRYLQESDREIHILFNDLLIGVTSFFRDPEAYEALKIQHLPVMLQDKPDDYQIRVWVPGCSSGEEAYSIAIVIQECMETLARHLTVQIFATDLDEQAIEVARAGIYPASIEGDIPEKRLKKFFTKSDNYYQINKNIREMVVFSRQNLIKDPPFTKLDLLCCRNLLIYFSPELQKKLLPIFHYSLKHDGILFLGASESIGQATDLFAVVDKKWRIFKRLSVDTASGAILEFPKTGPEIEIPAKESPEVFKPLKDVNTVKLLQALLAQSTMPTCVVIDDSANIIYIHGRTGRYLELAEGETNINILEMARPGLRTGLTRAIAKMATERQEIIIKNLQIKNKDGDVDLNLIVKPLPDFQVGRRGMMMVIFDEITPPKEKNIVKAAQPAQQTCHKDVKRLEEELLYTKENLQTTIEELEISNEEFKSTNEELQSTNEELQSTNEELETSKEELQSLNEESSTLNMELQSRIDELVVANDDIKNLLNATGIAILFLDIDLNVRRFTAKTTEIFPLTTGDCGRPIKHFTSNLQDVALHTHAEKVLRDLGKQELEVTDKIGTIYRMCLSPYRTTSNLIDGVVITFEDITELKHLVMENRLAAIVRDSNDAITLQDFNGNIIVWNKGAEKMYGYTEAKALRMQIEDIIPQDKRNELKVMLNNLQKDKDADTLVTERRRKDGEILPVLLTVRLLSDETSGQPLIVTTERDLSKLNKEALLQATGGGSAAK